ncbi:MAG: hypothetical protein V4702_06515 [Patescibacteria group bacterium]
MPLKTKTSLVIDELLKAVLIGGAGLATIAAPNSLVALEKPLKAVLKKLDKSVDSRKLAYYTKRLNVVTIDELENGLFEITLNDKGRKRVQKANFELLQVPRVKKWDQRWRLVVFDIPEKYRDSRRFLTEKLKTMDFYMLQKSLWVHPFPCLEQIALIKHIIPELEPFVVLLETDTIDQHNRLINHFRKILPL